MKNRLTGAWPLFVAWGMVLAAVSLMTLNFESESDHFYGIAESREIVVNSEVPVEIRRVNVVEGQSITKGQLMVELNSPELNLKINEISHQLEQLTLQKGLDKADLQSKIAQLEAEKASRTMEINNRINQLESQYRLNKELAGKLKSIDLDLGLSRSSSPLILRIKQLKKELETVVTPMNIQISLYRDALNASDSPIAVQAERLRNELDMLQAESSRMNIYAQISGVIGSINFKPGEKAAPFAPIITLHTQTPSFVKGYIFENAYSQVTVGEALDVSAFASSKHAVHGTVVGVGARIVEYPVRLRKHRNFQMWGREVLIRITEDNPFILGEKVMISSVRPQQNWPDIIIGWLSPPSIMAETPAAVTPPSPKPIPIIPRHTAGMEASGIINAPEWGGYVVISDETPENTPLLFVMSENGRIIKEMRISGLKRISDLEGITTDADGNIYVAASMSVSAKGNLKPARRILAKVRKTEDGCELVSRVDLYHLLATSASDCPETPWARFVLSGVKTKTLDMEGISWTSGDLLLAFKAPFNDAGDAVILKIKDIESVIAGNKPNDQQISVWRKIRFNTAEENYFHRISGICLQGDRLFLTTVPDKIIAENKGKKAGTVWQMDLSEEAPLPVARFENFQPEGVCRGMKEGTLGIVFDQGGHQSSYFTHIESPT